MELNSIFGHIIFDLKSFLISFLASIAANYFMYKKLGNRQNYKVKKIKFSISAVVFTTLILFIILYFVIIHIFNVRHQKEQLLENNAVVEQTLKNYKNEKNSFSSSKIEFSFILNELNKLKGIYQDIDSDHIINNKYSNIERNYIVQVLTLAPLVIRDLESINDDSLTPAYKIQKYEYLAYSHVIFADLNPELEEKKKLINKGEEYLSQAIRLIENARLKLKEEDESDGYNYKGLIFWIEDNNKESLLYFLESWYFSLEERFGMSEDGCEKADVSSKKIKAKFKQFYDPQNNPSINWCKERYKFLINFSLITFLLLLIIYLIKRNILTIRKVVLKFIEVKNEGSQSEK